MKLGLSTMWGIGRFPTLREFFKEAKQFGFARFELNHGVTSWMLVGIENLLDSLTITSIHEPCPADPSVEELGRQDLLISSLDPGKRKQGIQAVKRSIELASRLSVPLVIVHPGRVNVERDFETPLRALYQEGKGGTEEYQSLLTRYREERNQLSAPHLEAVRESLKELSEFASQKGVRLGLENRFYYHEIPTPDELEALLGDAPAEWVGFWYDVGHGEVLHRLGLIPQTEWLSRFSPFIIGVHLHDVKGIQDHRPAGLGTVDWEAILPKLPPHIVATCEFQSAFSAEEIASGVQFLTRQFSRHTVPVRSPHGIP